MLQLSCFLADRAPSDLCSFTSFLSNLRWFSRSLKKFSPIASLSSMHICGVGRLGAAHPGVANFDPNLPFAKHLFVLVSCFNLLRAIASPITSC